MNTSIDEVTTIPAPFWHLPSRSCQGRENGMKTELVALSEPQPEKSR